MGASGGKMQERSIVGYPPPEVISNHKKRESVGPDLFPPREVENKHGFIVGMFNVFPTALYSNSQIFQLRIIVLFYFILFCIFLCQMHIKSTY